MLTALEAFFAVKRASSTGIGSGGASLTSSKGTMAVVTTPDPSPHTLDCLCNHREFIANAQVEHWRWSLVYLLAHRRP